MIINDYIIIFCRFKVSKYNNFSVGDVEPLEKYYVNRVIWDSLPNLPMWPNQLKKELEDKLFNAVCDGNLKHSDNQGSICTNLNNALLRRNPSNLRYKLHCFIPPNVS